MKKYCYSFLILLTLLIVSIMMLSACSISVLSQATPPYDFAIYDRNNKTYLYSNPEGNTQAASLVDTLKRKGEDYRFWGLPFSWEMDGSFFTKTTASAKDLKVSLVKISPDSPANPSYKGLTSDSIDIYTSAVDQEFFYTIDVYIDRLMFKKYDQNLKFLKKTEIDNKGRNIAANQLLSIGADLFLLVGIVDPQQNVVSIKSEIWKLDKDFNILETYSLPESKGFLLRMVHDGEFFYITSPISDSNASNGVPSHSIYVYQENVQKKRMEFVRTIELDSAFPKELSYDQASQCLLISHDSQRTANLCWTVYDLKNDQESRLDFPEYIPGTAKVPRDPNFIVHEGKCYILLKDHLAIYDLVLKQLSRLDYPDESIEPFYIIFNDKDFSLAENKN